MRSAALGHPAQRAAEPISEIHFQLFIPPADKGVMNDHTRLAEAVRTACLEAALRAYEEAGISGLCHEGRWEYAVQAIQGIDLTALINQVDGSADRDA